MNLIPSNGKSYLRDVDRTFVQVVMFGLGILPMENVELDMGRVLRQLDPAEARKFKRKFRKIWRQQMKTSLCANGQSTAQTQRNQESLRRRLGVGKQFPSRAEHYARKKLVFDRLWREVIKPMLQRFESPENKKKNANAHDHSENKATKVA